VTCSCFVSNKFVKLPVKQLKSILSDFYTVEALTEAKIRLLSDIESMEASVQIPHVPCRRDGGNRVAREVDDIVTLSQFVDENKLLANLPMYVVCFWKSRSYAICSSVRRGFKYRDGNARENGPQGYGILVSFIRHCSRRRQAAVKFYVT